MNVWGEKAVASARLQNRKEECEIYTQKSHFIRSAGADRLLKCVSPTRELQHVHVFGPMFTSHTIKTQITVESVRPGGQRSMGREDTRHPSAPPQYKHCRIE